jgi:DNA-binding NtrC family response regulator
VEDILLAEEVPPAWHDKTLPEVEEMVLAQVEKLYIHMVLKKSGGRVGEAASRAGIHSRSLYNKMKRLGLKKEDFKHGHGRGPAT